MFSASNGGTTVSSQAKWGNYFTYLIAKADAWDKAAGYARNGHGVGMSQRGAQYAANSGRTCNEILTFYYPGTSLISNYSSGGGVQPPVPEGSTRYVNVPVGQTVNIREGAGTTFGILYTWSRGTKCYAETPSATWSAVTRDDGQTGFVMTQYLSATNPDGSGSGYADWQSKYGNNTFVVSSTFSGNVQRYQTDLNLWLRANGYATIATDGLYGSGTMTATRSFQAAYGLAVDGYAGPITKALLFPMYT